MSNSEIEYIDLREEEPEGSKRIKDVNTTNLLEKIVNWLIKKLAGKKMVILNAQIFVVKREDDKNIIGKLAQSKGGSLMVDSHLYCDDKYMLQLTNCTEVNR